MNQVCVLKNDCSGCTEWGHPYSEQVNTKRNHFKQILQTLDQDIDFDFITIAESGLRDRIDLVIQNSKIGLYKKNSREIIDIPECLQLSPALQIFLNDFRKIKIPIDKGSIRLRVSPSGDRGLWLDFANLDIKGLLDEKLVLFKLLDLGFVEIGQRRKKLNSNLKLVDPELHAWTRSWCTHTDELKPVPLYQCVSHFSQVGDQANKVITQTVSTMVEQSKAQNICEFGSGNGNLTFSFLTSARKVTCLEIEELALQGLAQTAKEQNLSGSIKTISGDFQNRMRFELKGFDAIVANPPRSGLMKFLDEIEHLECKPNNFIYMSCFPESFQKDSAKLISYGYRLNEAKIIDQFPQTKHYEIAARFVQS
jgi:23S rRNA (uracil1939-C5)-methyltransferase